ncbi:hypothetical protein KEM56_004610 [Ascosphaera pollenicola]|nr:hypothetical protein KEM56_004610 [Ascosphaera pollenicola]
MMSPSASSATPTSCSNQAADEYAGLSKRQLNQLKRKNKQSAKLGANKIRVVDLAARSRPNDSSSAMSPSYNSNGNGNGNGWASPLIKKEEDDSKNEYFSLDREGPDDTSRVVSEFKGAAVPDKPFIQSEVEEQGLVWPYERMCEFLMIDLFYPTWEIRHGAAMGLREVIRVQGKGAGRIFGKTRAQNDAANKAFLNDLACRLLCVFLLDRFGDFVSDNVVAPIRETVGQTLGALLSHLPDDSVVGVYTILYRMIMQHDLGLGRQVWEVCHGGMIGLKYLVAVRTDVLLRMPQLMDGVISAVMKGLGDDDDDVRSVSAATLIPIADDFVRHRSDESLTMLVNIVWSCLSNLQDDLSASTGSVMDLLAKLCTFPTVLEAMKRNAERDVESSFEKLVPRLFPFLRHTITSVRSAVLRALLTFLRLDGRNHNGWVDGKAMRLIFQNILVERNEGVLKLSLQVWFELIAALEARGDFASTGLQSSILPIIKLTVGAFGLPRFPIPMDITLFIRPSGVPYSPPSQPTSRRKSSVYPGIDTNHRPGNRRRKEKTSPPPMNLAHNVDGHMISGDVDLVGADTIIRARIHAAIALGGLLAIWDRNGQASLWEIILPYLGLTQPSTTQVISAMVIEEYVKAYKAKVESPTPYAQVLSQTLLTSIESDRPNWYSDIVSYLHIARAQCHSLVNAFRDYAHVPQSRLPTPAVIVQGDPDAGPNAFSLADAERIVGPDYERVYKTLSPAQRMTAMQILSESKSSADHAVSEAQQMKAQRDARIKAALAAAIVALGAIPKKPSVVIKGMMESVKTEENVDLQYRSSAAVASLVEHYTRAAKRGPVDKIIGNLVTFCCVDTSETPEFQHNAQLETAILSLRKEEDKKDPVDLANYEQDVRRARIMRRGAKEALEQLTIRFGPHLFEKVPNLAALIETPLQTVLSGDLPANIRSEASTAGQEVIDGLSTLRALVHNVHRIRCERPTRKAS